MIYIEYYAEFITTNGGDIFIKIQLCLTPLIFTLGIYLLILAVLNFEQPAFILSADKIFTIGDIGISNKYKFQHYTEVEYKNIASLDIIWSSCNSKGKACRSVYAMGKSWPYLTIVDKHGEKHNFSIQRMSKKGMRNFLNELNARIVFFGNNVNMNIEEMMKKFPPIFF